jgi:outer membrane receptor protein involved in Fe transport
LRPEKARTWTLGVDWVPSRVPGLRASASYYNITFRDRITNAQLAGFDITDALRIENELGPQIIQRNPSASLVQSLAATAGYVDFCNPSCPLSTIGAIVDSRQLNLSALKTSGIDLGVSYRTDSSLGKLETGLDGTYIFKFDNQITQNSSFIKLRDTPFNPTDLKLRARVIIQRSGWTFATFCNYVSSYTDNRNGGSVPVSSWTTLDASVGYQFETTKSVLRNTSATLSVVNIANRAPPFVIGNFPGLNGAINYDGANANVLGRIIGLNITKAL